MGSTILGGGDWLRGGMGTVLSNLQNYGVQGGNNYFNQFAGPLSGFAQQEMEKSGAVQNSLLYGDQYQPGLVSNLQNYQAGLPGMMQNFNAYSNPLMAGAQQGMQGAGQSLDPGMQAAMGNFANTAGGTGNTANLAGQVFAGGGWTPQYQQGFDAINHLLKNGAPGSGSSNFAANNLIGRQGQTEQNVGAFKLAGDVLGGGGWIPQLNMGLDPTQQILNNQGATGQSRGLMSGGQDAINGMFGTGGLTPTGATAEAAGLQGILQGGANPYNVAAQNQGLQYMQQPALMSPEQAASLATNQAGTIARQGTKQAFEQAMTRGGGPGAITGGIQNEAMNDASDKIQQAQAKAFSDTLMNQQQLQLQQQGQGTQMFNAGAGNQQGMLNAFAGLQGQNENVAANRFSTGANMLGTSGQLQNQMMLGGLGNVNSMVNTAAGYVSPYEQLGSNAMNNMSSMLGQGANISDIMQRGYLGGIQNIGQLMGNENQYALGMGNLQNQITQGFGGLGNTMAGTQGNIYNQLYGTGIQGGQLGLNQFQGLTGAQNQGFNQQMGMGNLLNSQTGQMMNPLQFLAGQGMGLMQTGLSGQSGLFGGGASQAGGGGLLSQLGQVAGAAAGAAAGSSLKFKENIEDITLEEANRLMELYPVSFNYIGSKDKEYGLVAEEVEKVLPEVIKYDDEGKVWGIFYQRINGLLLKKVQELEARLAKLEGK